MSFVLVAWLAACGSAVPADAALSGAVVSHASGRRATPFVRVSPGRRDAWVLRFEGSTRAEIVLPSFASPDQPVRKVSRRTPHLFWSNEGDRLVAETIGGGFVVVYFPSEGKPFACPHRILRPTDVPLAWRGTPTLEGLGREMLTDPARPHDTAEQHIVFEEIRRAGVAGERGAVLVDAALHASRQIDEDGLARLLSDRLGELPAAQRERELGALAGALRSEDPPEPFGAAAARAARALGVAGARDYDDDVGAAMARVVRISRAPTNAPKVVDAAKWLAWAAGRLGAAGAKDPLRDYLDVPYEVPFKTRVARSLAAWALVRLRDASVRAKVARWNGALDRTLPAASRTMPSEAEMARGPDWAGRVSSAAVADWVRAHTPQQ